MLWEGLTHIIQNESINTLASDNADVDTNLRLGLGAGWRACGATLKPDSVWLLLSIKVRGAL
jgi:hypothetical protein